MWMRMSVFSYEDSIRGINQALVNIHTEVEKDRRKSRGEHEKVMRGMDVILHVVLILGVCVLLMQGRDGWTGIPTTLF
jgi:hypothetical protein